MSEGTLRRVWQRQVVSWKARHVWHGRQALQAARLRQAVPPGTHGMLLCSAPHLATVMGDVPRVSVCHGAGVRRPEEDTTSRLVLQGLHGVVNLLHSLMHQVGPRAAARGTRPVRHTLVPYESQGWKTRNALTPHTHIHTRNRTTSPNLHCTHTALHTLHAGRTAIYLIHPRGRYCA